MDNESLKKLIESIDKEAKPLEEQLEKLYEARRALVKICPHDWGCIGHDSHKDHYLCSICGDREIW